LSRSGTLCRFSPKTVFAHKERLVNVNKILPLYAACATACLLNAANVSAMYVDPKGEGQALIYPYYTVNQGQQTLLTVANTDSNGKALRISFREGLNGRDVLSFNLYLAAHDTWTGVVFALSDAGLGAPGSGAAITSNDQSCTTPALPETTASGMHYQHFLDYDYTGKYTDSGPTTDDRTREGFFEIIEMADVSSNLVDASKISCVSVLNLTGATLKTPTGGLTGNAAIINVAQGTYYAYDATAIQGFLSAPKFTLSGQDDITLGSASSIIGGNVPSTAFVDGKLREVDYTTQHSVDAVSALLINERLDLQIENSPGIATDWVLTFPTKQFYVDQRLTNTTTAIAPFRALFGTTTGQSPFKISMDVWDREDHSVASDGVAVLPFETNVLSASSPSGALGAVSTRVPFPFTGNVAGQATVSLNPNEEAHSLRAAVDGTLLKGLPVIGFQAINYLNANAAAGVLANYSGAYPLKGH